MINIGIVGIGDIGATHLERLSNDPNFNVVGCLDTDNKKIKFYNNKYDLKTFEDLEDLLPEIEALLIASPTTTHYKYAADGIRAGKHIFIEKPITHTILQANELIKLATESGVVVQIGHLERFNPALIAINKNDELQPRYIEAERLSTYNTSTANESLVLDHIIHDIDIALKMAKANVKSVHASGAKVISETIDIANARIEFDNGCVASLTTNRAALSNKSEMRFFQKETCVSVDLLNKKTNLYRIEESKNNGFQFKTGPDKGIKKYDLPISSHDAIQLQHNNFYESVIQNNTPEVCAYAGTAALELSYEILKMIEKNMAH